MANGNFGGGDGSTGNPFLIEDADDLNKVRQRLSSNFRMVNDINLGETRYNTGSGWVPIGGFTGDFDGGGHRIINLYINLPQNDYVGFFSSVDIATIHDVAFDNAVVVGRDHVGIAVGTINAPYDYRSQLKGWRILTSGTITANSYAGGVIGSHRNWGSIGGRSDGAIKTVSFTMLTQCISNVVINCQSMVSGIMNTWSSTGSNGFCQAHYGNCMGQAWIYAGITNCVVVGQFSNMSNYRGNVFSSVGGPLATGNNSVYFDMPMVDKCSVTSGDNYCELSNVPVTTTEYLPDLDDALFDKTPGQPVNFVWNVDRSYFIRLNDGYYVYDFNSKTFVRKYLTIDASNVRSAIANGHRSLNLLTTSCFELLKSYGKFDVISVQNSTTSFASTVKVASFNSGSVDVDVDHVSFVGHVNFADNNGEVAALETM